MAKEKTPLLRFNGGEVGKDIDPLVDLEKYPAAASIMENWLATVQGEMHMRGGLGWCSSVSDAGRAMLYPFVFSASQRYGARFTSGRLRILQDGDVIIRPTVATVIQNGNFSSLSGWTNISVSPSTATAPSGLLRLYANGTSQAGIKRQITIATADVEHAINLVVTRGPVKLRVGSAEGGIDLLNVDARTGFHSLAFTPTTSTVWIEIVSTDRAIRNVESIAIAPSGDMIIETPYLTDESYGNLGLVQSTDTLFIVNGLNRPMRLERRGVTSWSLVEMDISDGPFETQNVDEAITVKPSAIYGNGTLEASQALWTEDHVGALWRLTHSGQRRNRNFSSEGVFTDTIMVQGAGAGRKFRYTLSGSFNANVTLQRSMGNTTSWVSVQDDHDPGTYYVEDELDNQIAYYRLIILPGDYTSGNVTAELFCEGGMTVGVVRLTTIVSPTLADMEVISVLGDTDPTYEWAEGSWSDYMGWPDAISEHDERIYFGNYDRFKGSIAGSYESQDAGNAGASDAIARRVRGGPIRWIIALSRLLVGTEGMEHSARSSAFEEPITPNNITIRPLSNIGSSATQPIVVDTRAIFIDRSGSRIYEILYSVEQQDYVTGDISELHKKIGRPGIVQMALQRQPDTRIFMIRKDGQCVVLLFDPKENVKAFQRLVTDGAFESVIVLPGDVEDEVYFVVRRIVNGNTVRFTERLAPFEVEDAKDACYGDSYIRFQGAPRTTLAVPHLEGREVVIWADGAYHPPRIVTAGSITFERPVSRGMVGLYYSCPYKGMRNNAGSGAGITDLKRPYHMSMLLRDSTPYLKYGTSFDEMENLTDRTIAMAYDSGPGLQDIITKPAAVPGRHVVDPRLCLLAEAPYGPVIVQALVPTTQINVKG